jgi:choline dehydrogenase-like flavoprotein
MNFVVPASEDLDTWAKLGNPGWDWGSFSRYLKKTYTVTSGSSTENNGAIETNIPEEETKWPRVWRDTLAGLGYPADNDPFSGDICGAVMYPDAINPKTKTRSYVGNAYLGPARDRPNLTIWTGIAVEKVLLTHTSDGAVATGVQYTRGKDGQSSTVAARKEVILSAGVFHSPRILELSGIGGAELLRSLGIDVVVDNPHVGENLQHHPMSIVSFETVDDGEEGFDTIDAIARQDSEALRAAMEAYAQGRGPFSRTNCNAMAHLPFPDIDTERGRRELDEILNKLLPPAAAATTTTYIQAAEAFVRSVLTDPARASGYYVSIPVGANPEPSGGSGAAKRYFTIAVLLTRPLSRGSVHLAASQPGGLAINPNYLAHPLDLEVLAHHVRFLKSTLARAEPLASRLKLPQDATTKETETDLAATRQFLRNTAQPSTLYTSTCAMMPRELGGVVDPALRVHGTRNLRVVDASVMPFITRGDTMAAVYGIAEKAADVIRWEWAGK